MFNFRAKNELNLTELWKFWTLLLILSVSWKHNKVFAQGQETTTLSRTDIENAQTYQRGLCYKEPDIGDCIDVTPLWFYNASDLQCQQFYYGGCLGNRNKFIQRSLCEDICRADCMRPPDEGKYDFGADCQLVTRWYYDYNSNAPFCKSFNYTGCQGNGNNFISRTICNQFCKKDICELKPMKGDGSETMTRFFYNKTSGICESFVYSGEGGNTNNFVSEEFCLRQCGSVLACPLIECLKLCPYGYVINRFGCHQCDCIEPCEGVVCRSHQQCIVFTRNCDVSSCRLLPKPEGRCVEKCDSGQVYDTCTKQQYVCDPSCTGVYLWCSPIPGCFPRCRCPDTSPVLLNGKCQNFSDCSVLRQDSQGLPQQQVEISSEYNDVNVLLFCNFEDMFQPMCGLSQWPHDDGEWLIHSGQGPNPLTGPDKAIDGKGHYLLFNSALLGVVGEASFMSPVIYTEGMTCFSFMYFMYGRDVDLLLVEGLTSYMSKEIWTAPKKGIFGELAWQKASLTLSMDIAQVKVTARRGGSGKPPHYADIAIDNVQLTKGKCTDIYQPEYQEITVAKLRRKPKQQPDALRAREIQVTDVSSRARSMHVVRRVLIKVTEYIIGLYFVMNDPQLI